MSLHDLRLAMELDRVVVVEDGDLRADGKPQTVLTNELLKTVFGVWAEKEDGWNLQLT
jgi:iron complex transport system ATP-binding protein